MSQIIPLDRIERNPNQPRETFEPMSIERLAESIRKRGLISPITVRPIGGDRYMIVAGERRFRAHQLLGRDTIRAVVAEIDADEMQLQAIVENLQRRDMNPIEEAKAFKTLIDRGYTPAMVAHELSLESPAIVTKRLSLLNLTAEIQGLVISGQLEGTKAWAVALVPPHRQSEVVKQIACGRLKTSDQVKAAAFAVRDAETQLDAFGGIDRNARKNHEVLTRLEAKVDQMVELVALGFKDGECVAAQRCSPTRLQKTCQKLGLIADGIRHMQRDLNRALAIQGQLFGDQE